MQEVTALLGSPSITDPFQPERWDYAESQRIGRTSHTQVRDFTVYFENGLVTRWEGDYFSNEDEELAHAANTLFGPNLLKNKQQDQ